MPNSPSGPPKAYRNLNFLNSSAARTVRILCEYEEPRARLDKEAVEDTIVFFGSARTRASDEAAQMLAEAEAKALAQPGDPTVEADLTRARIAVRMSGYYDAARELAARLTLWSRENEKNYLVCSGGGPGIMEAANRGAADVGGRSVGLGISLPFEQGVNQWVTPELGFEFHYFFMRKYWFLYLCKALVIFPGGFGTMDELFETLTLVQTGKIKRRLPVVLFGRDYWDRVMNLEVMVETGTISPKDVDLIYRVNTVDEAFSYLTGRLGG